MKKNIFSVGLLLISVSVSLSVYAQPVADGLKAEPAILTKTAIEIDGEPLFSIKASSVTTEDSDIANADEKKVEEVRVVKVIDFTEKSPPAALLLGKDADEVVTASRSLKRATSYTVRGKTYRTLAESQGFVEEGSASWYGPGFHGRKTASGEVFDMNALTAAHKELPLGTEVEVTNLSTGKSIVVRINDRGPFHGNRVLDLSRAAAKELGVIKHGTATVSIRALQ